MPSTITTFRGARGTVASVRVWVAGYCGSSSSMSALVLAGGTDADPSVFATCARIILKDPNVGGLLLVVIGARVLVPSAATAADITSINPDPGLAADDWLTQGEVEAGAGYVFENRAAMTRVFPDLIRANRLRKLVNYYQTMRNTLQYLAPGMPDDPRIVLLSPGPSNETYFEHAYHF